MLIVVFILNKQILGDWSFEEGKTSSPTTKPN
jgi:hypothetical protein